MRKPQHKTKRRPAELENSNITLRFPDSAAWKPSEEEAVVFRNGLVAENWVIQGCTVDQVRDKTS